MCPFVPFVCRTCEAHDMRLGKVCAEVPHRRTTRRGTKKKKIQCPSLENDDWNLLPIYPHTCGDKRKIVNRKKSVTHTYTPHQFGMRGRKCRVLRLFIYTYIPVYFFIKCATRTRAEERICVMCMMSFLKKRKEKCVKCASASTSSSPTRPPWPRPG